MKGKIEILLNENKDNLTVEVNVDAESTITDPVEHAIEKAMIVKALLHGLKFNEIEYVTLAISMATNMWPDDQEYPDVDSLPLRATIAKTILGGI